MPAKNIWIALWLLLSGTSVIAQKADPGLPDSLLRQLALTTDSAGRAGIYLELSGWHERRDVALSRKFAEMALNTGTDSIQPEAYNKIGRSYFYQNQPDSAIAYFLRSTEAFEARGNPDKAAAVRISAGAAQMRQGRYQEALTTFFEGLGYFESARDSMQMGKTYNNIATIYGELGDVDHAIEYGEKALAIFRQYGLAQFRLITLPNLAGQYARQGDTLRARTYFREAEKLAGQMDEPFALARIYNNLGNLYLDSSRDSSEYYLNRSLEIKTRHGIEDGMGTLYNNLGYLNLKQGRPTQAARYLERALDHGRGANSATIHTNLAQAYEATGNNVRALASLKRGMAIKDSLMEAEYRKSLAELSSKYESERMAAEMLSLQNNYLQTDIRRKQNRNLLYLAIGILLLLGVTTYFMVKNARRKRIIAEQQKELEHQRAESLVSELETVSLDSLIEGQEKERQRIAEELHDSLGANLSALKLYVEEVSGADPALHKKLRVALDQSYEDLRNISRGKNSYVLIDNGLVPAVREIARQLKSSRKIHVEVTNIDLNKRIQNSRELQLFRILQELLTNTLKHADANQVSIQFSEDDGQLHVVYEDDGKGFDPGKVKKGQGQINIENRIRKMDGNLVVESEPGEGVNVIISVPI